jgi:hypothetical protein
MEQIHVSYLNRGWYQGVTDPTVGRWVQSTSGYPTGCRDVIARRLGYRFVLDEVVRSQQVRPGDPLQLTVTLTNVGFAAMYNPRPVIVILRSPTGVKYMADLSTPTQPQDVDPRYWLPGAAKTFTRNITIPSDAVPADNYTIALWMPDETEGNRDDVLYSVRFASMFSGTTTPVWETSTHYNVLTTTLDVDGAAPANTNQPNNAFVPCSAPACP